MTAGIRGEEGYAHEGGAGAKVRGASGLSGVMVAGVTALISGLSVFVNSYGVHSFPSPSVYTTVKNLVATVILTVGSAMAWNIGKRRPDSAAGRFTMSWQSREPRTPPLAEWRRWSPARWVGLAYVGIVGGGVAFVLFFNGLARTTATPAAFWRDTMVLWVVVLAIPFLRERLVWWNIAAIAVLIAGQISVAGGVGKLGAGQGELLVLAATMLWAIEVIVAKRLLQDLAPAVVAVVRMAVGAVALIVYLAATGALHDLATLTINQVGWALLTGCLLAAYVATWMTALARARAIDVTSILVGSVVVTAVLQAMAGTASLAPETLGLLLIAGGAGMFFWANVQSPVTSSDHPVAR